jgi:hypothetical protein
MPLEIQMGMKIMDLKRIGIKHRTTGVQNKQNKK